MAETVSEFAARLIAAHDGGLVIDAVPDHLVPADWAGIYALQDAIIRQIGPVGGWKILAGGTGEPNCSPIPANRLFADGATINSAHHRFVLAEVEIAIRLGADLAANADTATAEAAIASIHPILEMVGSPFVNRDAVENNARLGDLQSNGAVIIGPALDTAIKNELTTLPVRLLLDGVEAKVTTIGASWSAIVEVVRWLATHAASRGLPLKAGNVIITGARVVAPHGTASRIEGRMGDWGSVSAVMTY